MFENIRVLDFRKFRFMEISIKLGLNINIDWNSSFIHKFYQQEKLWN